MIEHKFENNVAEICINRPEKKNALSHDMYYKLAELFDQYGHEPSCHAIIIYGANNTFTAGADLNDFKKARGEGDSAGVTFLRAISKAKAPVIAAVEGVAVGIGATMLQHCDFVYIGEETRLRMPFAALGLCPEGASTYLLQLAVKQKAARDWLLTARFFDAKEAYEAGLATKLVEKGTALEHARETAETLTQLPATSLHITKEMLNDWDKDNVQKAFDNEVAMFAKLLSSKDTQSQIDSTGKTRKS